ncbi:hypothetical protein PV08_08767 [Exophiala spinifera]|uniref:Ubiquitin-like protease family profile domain-containing protein n=1 Tax=Exophiala spinifera TaxID=91928 RepID=A0A0D2B3V4_9EURO|nr:uncharacterized protein PV08_08767 [Exophiala spinifera]KIW13578.1 hypothetical protein PV08_08767 [Exophiala spinifera]
MRSNWTENVRNAVRSSFDNFLPRFSEPVVEDNSLIARNSNSSCASHSSQKRVPIPQQGSREYLTKRLNNYIRDNDPAQNDPIPIEDDDQEDTSENNPSIRLRTSKPLLQTRSPQNHEASSVKHAPPRHMPTRYPAERERGTTERRSIDNSQSAHENWLLGVASKPEPGFVTIQDPMKQPSSLAPGYRPVNTLNGARPPARPGHIHSTAHPSRGPQSHAFQYGDQTKGDALNHRHKRRKLEQPRTARQSNQDPIDIGESQQAEDSLDELGMSPAFGKGHTHQRDVGAFEDKRKAIPAQNLRRAEMSASSEDESTFTKASAQQRRAGQDESLKTSSVIQRSHATQAKVASPYFGKSEPPGRTSKGVRKTRQPKSLGQESPDALQESFCISHPRPAKQNPTSLDSVPATTFTRNLLGNDKNSAITNATKKPITKTQTLSPRTFKLLEFVSVPDSFADASLILEVDERTKRLEISTDMKELDTAPLQICLMEKINVLMHENQSNLVRLDCPRRGNTSTQTYLRLESVKAANDFVTLLQKLGCPHHTKTKDNGWIETALERAKDEMAGRHQKQATEEGSIIWQSSEQTKSSRKYPHVIQQDTARKQTRLIDRLDLPAVASEQPTVITGAERPGNDDSRPIQHSRNVQSSFMNLDRPDRSHEDANPLRRVTRSREPAKKDQRDQIPDSFRQPAKVSDLEILGNPWKSDLKYPITEKRSGTVPYEDLARLGHDEFLNDNLISFFVHYLENKIKSTKPELSPRIHIFNTYFFETLTKTPKGQKGRGINYEAVSKWTKAVDLFKRDFVVVPVNENFHWYLAIICNLPYFLPESEQGAREEIQPLILEDPSAPVETTDGDASEEQTQKSLAELSISDYDTSHQTASKAKAKKGPGKRRVSRLPKYDTDKPVIITLDSLGTPRSATSSILRQYVAAEAKNKKGLDLEPSDLRGMTAKKIPTQSNFSDCGLYLCMYLEQFVANPDTFVYNILQREENTHQWPETIRGQDLRGRLRDLLLELHRKQEGQPSKMEIPEVGRIMIGKIRSPPSRSQHLSSPTDEEVDDQKPGLRRTHYDGEELSSHSKSTPASLDTDFSKDAQSGRTVNGPSVPGGTTSAADQGRSRDGSSLGKSSGEVVQVAASPPASHNRHRENHKDSSELAAHLRTSRKRQRPARDDDDVHQQIRPKSPSTEFLSGVESYVGMQGSSSAGENPSLTNESILDDEVSSRRRKRTRHLDKFAGHSQESAMDAQAHSEAPLSLKHNEKTSMQQLIPTKKRQIDMGEVEIYEDTDEEQIGGSGTA